LTNQGILIMKTLIYLTLAVGAIASPVLSFAQSTVTPLTRAEVRADLARVEQAGYDPSSGEHVNYPADIQAAEAKIAADNTGRATTVGDTGNDGAGSIVSQVPSNETMSTNSVGAGMSGSSDSGSRKSKFGHPANQCVGPAGFCVPYFGS
jgi:hypothetical protein